jgi:hypothetical protein
MNIRKGAAMNKRYVSSRDDLAVSISLATAFAIVVAAAAAMWVWSVVSENMAAVTVESSPDIP